MSSEAIVVSFNSLSVIDCFLTCSALILGCSEPTLRQSKYFVILFWPHDLYSAITELPNRTNVFAAIAKCNFKFLVRFAAINASVVVSPISSGFVIVRGMLQIVLAALPVQ